MLMYISPLTDLIAKVMKLALVNNKGKRKAAPIKERPREETGFHLCAHTNASVPKRNTNITNTYRLK